MHYVATYAIFFFVSPPFSIKGNDENYSLYVMGSFIRHIQFNDVVEHLLQQ